MKIKINTQTLEFIFNRLRLQEGIEKSKELANLSTIEIFKVLANAKFKKQKNFPLTNLEKVVSDKSGSYIRMYVDQKVEECEKEENLVTLPFMEVANLTLADFGRRNYA